MQLHGTMMFKDGSLHIGGCDINSLAVEYGTPLLVIDEKALRENCRKFHRGLEKYVPRYKLFYAAKAFLSMGICKIVAEEGFGLDVVSGGELYQALSAGFPAKNIAMHGNNKPSNDIRRGIDCGIGSFVVDNLEELDELEYLAGKFNKKIPVLLRVVPSLKADTHPYLDTGKGSKFGLPMEDGQADRAIEKIKESKFLLAQGLHSHLGSQITDLDIYLLAARENLAFAEKHREVWEGSSFALNLGGGFAIAYRRGEQVFPLDTFARSIGTLIKEAEARGFLPPIVLELEPGRSIIGPAGTTIYSVGWPKKLGEGNLIVPVNGGMSDNIRPALYDARYECCLVNRSDGTRAPVNSTVVGRLCESGDILIEDIVLPEPRRGDLLAISCTGAYTYAMASNYNGLPRPAVVLVGDGLNYPLINRETYKDLICNQVIPEHLQRIEVKNMAL